MLKGLLTKVIINYTSVQKMLVISSEKESKTATKLDEWFTVGIFLFKTIHTFYMHCKFGFRIYKKKTHYFILF